LLFRFGTARISRLPSEAILPESVGVVKGQRRAGRGRWTLWRDAGYGERIAVAGGLAKSLRESEGKYGLVVLRRRHGRRGLGCVSSSRHLEMREDLSNDGGVLDRGDQLHPTSAD